MNKVTINLDGSAVKAAPGTTLLQLAIGLRYPTSGSISVLGRSPSADRQAGQGRPG